MLVTYIRSSSYNNYEYCQMQFFITYVLGQESVSGKKAQLGTIVHKVMECLASCKKKLQDNEGKKNLNVVDDALEKINFTPNSLYTKSIPRLKSVKKKSPQLRGFNDNDYASLNRRLTSSQLTTLKKASI